MVEECKKEAVTKKIDHMLARSANPAPKLGLNLEISLVVVAQNISRAVIVNRLVKLPAVSWCRKI
jgi:hypothetical protein